MNVLLFCGLQAAGKAARLTPPTYAEGFDKIYYVHITEDSTLTAPKWQIEEMFYG